MGEGRILLICLKINTKVEIHKSERHSENIFEYFFKKLKFLKKWFGRSERRRMRDNSHDFFFDIEVKEEDVLCKTIPR
jgi:hypothetical protein